MADLRASSPHFDEQKFEELLVYIADRCRGDASFGDTKLNKVLAFSDFIAYAKFGAPITGAEYRRYENGPLARKLLPVRDAMVSRGDLSVTEEQRYRYVQRVTRATRPPQTALFDPRELALVDEVIGFVKNHTAESVSEISHRIMAGWAIVDEGETIPYPTIFVDTREPSPAVLAQVQNLAAEHGWTA